MSKWADKDEYIITGHGLIKRKDELPARRPRKGEEGVAGAFVDPTHNGADTHATGNDATGSQNKTNP